MQSRSGGRLTVLQVALGAQLRRHRETNGISPEAAGAAIRASRARIHRLESGRGRLAERDASALLTLYGVSDPRQREMFLALARRSGTPGWWYRYSEAPPSWFDLHLDLEQASSVIHSYDPAYLPGLLQTEEYARAVLQQDHPDGSAEEIERRVTQRMRRQQALTRPGAPHLWAVIDEAALWRLGRRSAVRAQIRRVIELAELPNITLQVMPFSSAGHAGAGGAFTILRFPESDRPDIVYLEQLTSALYLDQSQDVGHYLMVMDRLCVEARTVAKTSWLLHNIIKEI